jgi:hypothetical protein
MTKRGQGAGKLLRVVIKLPALQCTAGEADPSSAPATPLDAAAT